MEISMATATPEQLEELGEKIAKALLRRCMDMHPGCRIVIGTKKDKEDEN